jgi:hypothetical protein
MSNIETKEPVTWISENLIEMGFLDRDSFIVKHVVAKAKEKELDRLKEAYSMGRLGKSIKEFNKTFKQQEQ